MGLLAVSARAASAHEHTAVGHRDWVQQHDTWEKEHAAWSKDEAQWKEEEARLKSVLLALQKMVKRHEKARRAEENEIKVHEAGIQYHRKVLAENKITAEVRHGHYDGMEIHEKLKAAHEAILQENLELMALMDQLERLVRKPRTLTLVPLAKREVNMSHLFQK
jgi:hypothetical protein